MKDVFVFDEIRKIHQEADGKILAFNEDYSDRLYRLTTIETNEVDRLNLWTLELLKVFNRKDEVESILSMIDTLKTGEKLPPIILGIKNEDGKYNLIDGMHRLAAMRELRVKECEAFVMIVED